MPSSPPASPRLSPPVSPPVSPPGRRRLAAALLALGLALLALVALGLARGWAAVGEQSYLLAWCGSLLALDALVHLREGRSLLLSTPRAFALLAAHSASFWLVFELLNLRLANWHYVGVPPDVLGRTLGGWLCFATVLPAVLECAELARAFGVGRRARHRPLSAGPRTRAVLVLLGLGSLALPLAWPRLFFPLVWGFAVLLAEPWLDARGERCLLERARAGDAGRLLQLLVGGALAGLLWELYNAPSLARWVYTVPGFEAHGPVAMPWAGFLGFPPFALECWSVARLLVATGLVPEFEAELPARSARLHTASLAARGRAALAVSLLGAAAALALVQERSVRSTDPTVFELRALSDGEARALEHAGLRRLRALVPRLERDAGLLGELPAARRAELLAEARLLLTADLGTRGRLWLERAGVRTRAQLAAARPEQLAQELARLEPRPLGALAALDESAAPGASPGPRPARAELAGWVRAARAAERAPTARSD